jgi:hypothetical protein
MTATPTNPRDFDGTGMGLEHASKFWEGYAEVEDQKLVEATLRTLDATETAIATIAIPLNSAYLAELCLVGRKSDGSAVTAFKVDAAVRRAAGDVVIGDQAQTYAGNTELGTTAVVFAVSGGNLLINVTGVAATTIDWRAMYRLTSFE